MRKGRTENKIGRDALQVNLQANKKEVGWAVVQVNFKSHLSLAGVEGWASKIRPSEKLACFRSEQEGRKSEDCPAKKDHQSGSDDRLCHSCGEPDHLSWACPSSGGGKGSESQEGTGATPGQGGTGEQGRGSTRDNTRGYVNSTEASSRPKDSETTVGPEDRCT